MGNGLKVIVLPDHAAHLVAIDVWIKAGVFNETEKNNGVTHFIEHLLFKRTGKRGPGQVDMDIESLGATLDAATSRDWSHIHTVVARRFFATALEIIADVIMRPTFDPDDIERERRVILDEIARRDSDYTQVALGAFYAASYKAHPYRMPEEGTPENVRKLSRADILDYYNTYYVPNNISVVIVGDVEPQEAISAVGAAFQSFKRKDIGEQPAVTPEPAPDSIVRTKLDAKLSVSHLVIGFRAPSVQDEPDVYSMDVLLTYLGVGYRSWLSTELKDRQRIASFTLADFLTQRHPGVIGLYLQVKPQDVERAEQAVLAKVRDLRANPITEEELMRARRSLEGHFAFQNETFSGRANTLGFYDAIRDYRFAADYISKVREVTAKDVQYVAQKYMDPERAIIVVVGP